MSCRPGQIKRKGYTRQAYYRTDGTYVAETKVRPVCIQDRGNPPNLIGKMRKGELVLATAQTDRTRQCSMLVGE